MAGEKRERTRYADDLIIQCRSRAEAENALETVRQWVGEAGLTLHPEKTRIVDAANPGGFDFLGWHFESGSKWPREKSVNDSRKHCEKEPEGTTTEPARHRAGTQPETEGMGAVFSRRPREHIRSVGRMDTNATAMHPETKSRAQGQGMARPSEIYQCLLRGTWADLPESLRLVEASQSRMRRALTNCRAGCGKSARPVRREGGVQTSIPTPMDCWHSCGA